MSEVIKPQTVPELESRGWTFETAEGSDSQFPFRLELLRPSRDTVSTIEFEYSLHDENPIPLRDTSIEQGCLRVKVHGDLSEIDDNVVVGLYSTQRRQTKMFVEYAEDGEPQYRSASFSGPKLRNPLSGPTLHQMFTVQSVFGATNVTEVPMYLRLIPDPENGEGVFILGHPRTLEPLTLGAFVGTKCHVFINHESVRFYRRIVRLDNTRINCTHRGEGLVLLRFVDDANGLRNVHQVSNKRGYAVSLSGGGNRNVIGDKFVGSLALSYIPDTM